MMKTMLGWSAAVAAARLVEPAARIVRIHVDHLNIDRASGNVGVGWLKFAAARSTTNRVNVEMRNETRPVVKR